MAGRPRPRARRAPAVQSADTTVTTNEEDFFIQSKPQLDALLPQENNSYCDVAGDKDGARHRKKRKALAFEWVKQAPEPTCVGPELDFTCSSPELASEVVESRSEPSVIPAPAARERSVSVTPPPAEFKDEAASFARRAIEQVTVQHRKRMEELDAGLCEDETSSDTPLELNADLAQYYKGHDALQLRERALARELKIQRSLHEQRQQVHEEQDVVEILDYSNSPTVYEVVDSSDNDSLGTSDWHEAVSSRETPSTFSHAHGAEAASNLTVSDYNSEQQLEATNDTLFITLRGARGLEVIVKVRPTTRIGTMLGHFTQTHGAALAAEEKLRACVSFEGETLDVQSVVGDHELEDGDMLDVMW